MIEVQEKKYPYIAILGPTASGKSSLAFRLAKELDGEIVSCDSVQLYKGFNIGSAKATIFEQKKIKHHMINILGPEESFDAAQYAFAAKKSILDIIARKKLPIIVGGTGLYYRFLVGDKVHLLPSNKTLREDLKNLSDEDLFLKLSKLDPVRARDIHKNDRYRLTRALDIALTAQLSFSEQIGGEHKESFLPKLCILLDPPRAELHDKIDKRSKEMLSEGLIEEVKALRKIYPSTDKAMKTIGYQQVNQYLDGELESEEEMRLRILYATRQYAKRQVTFFKKLQADFVSHDPKEDYGKILSLL